MIAPLLLAAASAAMQVGGLWATGDGKALVRIAPCGAELCGRVERVLAPHGPGPALDVNNRNAALRSRSIEGLSLLTGFKPDGDHWAGRIYDPVSGRDYRSEIRRQGDTLDVKGCLGPFCRTQHWAARR